MVRAMRGRKNKFEQFIERLCQANSIRCLVFIYLNFCFAYPSASRYIEHKREPPSGKRSRNYRCSIHQEGKCSAEFMSFQQPQQLQSFMHYFRMYQRFSITYQCVMVLRKCLQLLLIERLPVNCYLLGRQPVFTAILETGLGAFGAFLHLLWRYLRLNHNFFRSEVFGFLMFTGEEVERERLNIANQLDERKSPDGDCADLHARLLRSIMRLPLETDQTSDQLQSIRPNRTREAHRLLCKKLVYISLPAFLYFFTTVILGGIYTCWCLLSDRKYLERYPGCDLILEQTSNSSRAPDWLLNPTWHRLLSIPFDFADAMVIWFDTSIGCLLYFPVFFILTEDTLTYCRRITAYSKRLERNLTVANRGYTQMAFDGGRQAIRVKPSAEISISQDRRAHKTALMVEDRVSFHRRRFEERVMGPAVERVFGESSRIGAHRYLEQLVCRSQHLIRDLFDQLNSADEFISDYVTIFAVLWLYIYAGITYYSSSKGKSVEFAFRIFQFVLFVIFTAISFVVLRLHSEAIRFYPSIFSIIANHRARNKQKFRQILEFFIGCKQATYTFFHQIPFLASSYMTIVGWTLSTTTVLENMLLRSGSR